MTNLIKSISSLFRKKEDPMVGVLKHIHKDRGLLWESIEDFNDQLRRIEGSVSAHTPEMQEVFPLKHDFNNGLYTREIFMPKGSLVVSYIHKQNHPSFFLEGEMSLLLDTGEVKKIKAPMKVFTEIGTQRVAYMHEDCRWVCVYKTDKQTIEEAEKEVYTDNYRTLPTSVLKQYLEKKEQLCLD